MPGKGPETRTARPGLSGHHSSGTICRACRWSGLPCKSSTEETKTSTSTSPSPSPALLAQRPSSGRSRRHRLQTSCATLDTVVLTYPTFAESLNQCRRREVDRVEPGAESARQRPREAAGLDEQAAVVAGAAGRRVTGKQPPKPRAAAHTTLHSSSN